jgi:hypothetical protein
MTFQNLAVSDIEDSDDPSKIVVNAFMDSISDLYLQ